MLNDLAISVEHVDEGVRVLRLAGEARVESQYAIHEAVERELAAAPAPPRFVLDLTELSFLDSASTYALVQADAAVAERGGRLVLVALAPVVRRVLDIVGLLDRFEVYADRAEALVSLTKR